MQKNDPILINIPHSSTYIPPEEVGYFKTTPNIIARELAVMTDHYCDDLYDTGHSMLRFPVSRLVCDPERFRCDDDETMSRVGMGAIYTSCSDGSPLKSITPDHKEKLLNTYYDTYHRRFDNAVREKLRAFGKCLIVDGHSFYDEPLLYESDQDRNRPDICIGTDPYHTPEKTERLLYRYFKGCGYSVAINRPFAGCIVPSAFYKKDRRVMSIMIEINRRLYIDHDINKTEGYQKIKKDIEELLDILGHYSR